MGGNYKFIPVVSVARETVRKEVRWKRRRTGEEEEEEEEEK